MRSMDNWYASMKGMPLTGREQQVLHALTSSATNAQIAKALGITTNTVKDYVLRLHRKLGVKNRIQLLIAAEKAGLIRLLP